MIRNASLLRKFAVLSAVTIAVLGVVVGWVIARQIERRAVAEAASSAESFTNLVVRPLFTPTDLRGELSPERVAALDRTLAPAEETGTLARIKLWSPDGTVIYSDDRSLIGRSFPLSHGLEEALEGETSAHVEHPEEEAENRSERSFGTLLEVYVPLTFPGEPEPSGAFEMYTTYEATAQAIRQDTRQLALVLLGALLVLYGALFRIVSGASARLRRQAEENQRLAMYDSLTELPNRMLFRDRVDQAVRVARRDISGLAVMILDIDRFKEINDTLGHHTGDLLLQQLGPRLKSVLRDPDTVARLGGDEIGILLPGVKDADAAVTVAGKIEESLQQAFEVGEMSLEVEASIGIALFPQHGEGVDELVQRADVAMYSAKRNQTGREVYSEESDKYSPERLILLGELRDAIERGEIVLHYQPKAELRTGRISGVEALARWEHPRRGLLAPMEFIPLAEPTALMRPLTAHVIDLALSQYRAWRDEGLDLTVAVNLSLRNLHDPTLPDQVGQALRKWRVDPTRLELEITESAIMQEPVRVREVVGRLRSLGVVLSVDDFGVGHSSLAYLKQLPVAQLKIDRSFIMNLSQDADDAAIVRSTIELGRGLGLHVVAEGVEDATAWDRLAGMGCDVAQGYYLSRPMPPEDLASWLRHHPDAGPGALTATRAAGPQDAR